MPQGKITSQYRQRGGLHVILLARSPYLYIYGTVRVGERSERVEYSTKLHHEMPGAWEAAETMLLIKEKEILERLLYNRPPPRPVEDLVSDYLVRHDYSYTVKRAANEIATAFRGVLIADLDRTQIEDYYKRRFPPHHLTSRRQNELVLHSILALAVRQRSLHEIPYWNRVQRQRPKTNPAVKRFHPGEVELLIECADPQLKPVIALIYATGARVWQTISLLREHVDLERGRGRVIFPKTKNGHAYVRPLHDYAVDQICIWLLRRNDDHPQLFLTSTHTPYSERQRGGGQFWWSFRRAKERCVAELKRRGFPERARVMEQATPHWLRHNFANCLRQVYGMDARGIADAGMWESVDCVNRSYIVSAPEIVEHQIRNLPLGQPLGSRP
jgi:integrase